MLNLEEEKSKFRFKLKLDIRWGDMDAMNHVNNAVYLTYFEQARILYFGEEIKLNRNEISFILASAHVDYLRPLVFPDPTVLYLRTSKFGNKSFEMVYLVATWVNGKEEISASGYTTLVMFDYKTNSSVVVPESLKSRIRNYEKEKI